MKAIEPISNDVLFAVAHHVMVQYCDCGFHSDDIEEHAPSQQTTMTRLCAWRKKVQGSADHASLLHDTRERGPLLEHDDAGNVRNRLRLPPGAVVAHIADMEELRELRAEALRRKSGVKLVEEVESDGKTPNPEVTSNPDGKGKK